MASFNSNPVNGLVLFDASTFERFDRLLHQYLRRRIRWSQDVEDLTQEIYVRLLRRNPANPVYKPLAYLYGIASHVVADYKADCACERAPLSFDEEALEDGSALGGSTDADQLADELNLQQQLNRALAQLPATHAAVLMAHKQQGLSYDEVAQVLDLSVHTVEKYVTQAKAMMKATPWDR